MALAIAMRCRCPPKVKIEEFQSNTPNIELKKYGYKASRKSLGKT